ncbi:12S rRNA N4-methylcytidine (m4C) methyltransferase isoform X4 [Talpa occidentalis]|uniref:12S rRNA N4-methylcytidine (m4C) methyltransferase isoform X4 n=1 Tax=Talpa occidentalis TaxID=50954 RepID=UPI0023FA1F54|nr:12S rRNA N4-methylcytidine (m4C) methyltransferase isoform X4 [Talpa occidentalis]
MATLTAVSGGGGLGTSFENPTACKALWQLGAASSGTKGRQSSVVGRTWAGSVRPGNFPPGLGPTRAAKSGFPAPQWLSLAEVRGNLRYLHASDLLIYKMLRYPYFCRIYKSFLSYALESGIFNLGIGPKKVHVTADRYYEYDAQEKTDKTGAQELRRFQDGDSEAVTKLHIPVMVDEVVHCLAPQKGQVFLDMTFGSGGHTRAILQKESDITLFALDRDPTAYAIAEQLSELYPKQIRALLAQFSQAEALLMKGGVQPGTLDGVLFDLGCSSMQLDTPERGFSLRKDGPLDMRMDGDRSTGTCIHPENIRGREARQENRFSNHSSTQHLPHQQNPAACQYCCRCISPLCYLCKKRLATEIYPYCYQDFPSFTYICEQ